MIFILLQWLPDWLTVTEGLSELGVSNSTYCLHISYVPRRIQIAVENLKKNICDEEVVLESLLCLRFLIHIGGWLPALCLQDPVS